MPFPAYVIWMVYSTAGRIQLQTNRSASHACWEDLVSERMEVTWHRAWHIVPAQPSSPLLLPALLSFSSNVGSRYKQRARNHGRFKAQTLELGCWSAFPDLFVCN